MKSIIRPSLHVALIAGALVLTALVFGTNLAQDWNVAGLQLIYAFLYYYLLVHRERNAVSIDGIRGRRTAVATLRINGADVNKLGG